MPPVTRTTTRKFHPLLQPGCQVYAPCEGSPGLYPGTLTADVNNLCTVIFDDYVGTICHNIPKQRVLLNNDPKVLPAKMRTLFDNPIKIPDTNTTTTATTAAAHSVICGSCQQPVAIMHTECRECEQICHATCFETCLYEFSNVPICQSCVKEMTQCHYTTDSSAEEDKSSHQSCGPGNSMNNRGIDNQDADHDLLQTQWPEAVVATVSKEEDDADNK